MGTLFQSEFDDKNAKIIKLSGPIDEEIHPRTFKSILTFCYTKQTNLRRDNVFDILAAAEFLQIDTLKEQCKNYLKNKINSDNWLKIYRVAMKWNYTALAEHCMDKFAELKNHLILKQLLFGEFYPVVKYSSEIVDCEDIFEMILSWVNIHQDKDKRQTYFEKLSQFIHFEWMDKTRLSYILATTDLITNSADVQQRINTAKLKLDEEKMLLLGGSDARCSVVKHVGNSWQKCADSLEDINGSAVASNGTHVFVVDGFGRKGHIQVYDIKEDTWSVIGNVLETPRWDATATIIKDKLYVFGGYGRDYISSTEVFTIRGSSCSPCYDHGVPALKTPRSEYGSVTRKNVVYFIGGCSKSCRLLSSCEAINVDTGELNELPSLYHLRSDLCAVLFRNSIVVIGGCISYNTFVNSVESYSFASRQWTVLQPMSASRWGHCAEVYKGQLFVIGGWDDNYESISEVEAYDPDNKLWKVHSALTTSRTCASVVKFV